MKVVSEEQSGKRSGHSLDLSRFKIFQHSGSCYGIVYLMARVDINAHNFFEVNKDTHSVVHFGKMCPLTAGMSVHLSKAISPLLPPSKRVSLFLYISPHATTSRKGHGHCAPYRPIHVHVPIFRKDISVKSALLRRHQSNMGHRISIHLYNRFHKLHITTPPCTPAPF